MGCCGSKEGSGKYLAPKPEERYRVLGAVFDAAESRQVGVQFHPTAAAFAPKPGQPLQSFVRVLHTEDYLFASLFDGHGGPEAAEHLHRSAHTAFSRSPELYAQEPTSALKALLEELDQDLAQASADSKAKASSGASAVVAVIDLKTNQLHAASVGGGLCVVAHTSGSFKQALTQAHAVADGRAAREAQQAVRRMHQQEGEELLQEAVQPGLSHTLGYTSVRSKDDTQSGVPLQCEVGSRSLAAGDVGVLLLSAGFLDLVSCTDAAVMAHLFSASDMQAYLSLAATSAGAGGTEGGAAGSQRGSKGGAVNRSKRLQELKASTRPAFNLAGLLAQQAAARTVLGIRASGVANGTAPRQLLSDAAVVCISVQFPQSYTSKQLSRQRMAVWLSRTLRSASKTGASQGGAAPGAATAAGTAAAAAKAASEAAAGAAAGTAAGMTGQATGTGAVQTSTKALQPEIRSSHVPFRWRLVAQYVAFLSQRRRAIHQRWHETYRELIVRADRQARQAELVTWQHMNEAVQVTRTGKVMRPGQGPTRPGTASSLHSAIAPAAPSLSSAAGLASLSSIPAPCILVEGEQAADPGERRSALSASGRSTPRSTLGSSLQGRSSPRVECASGTGSFQGRSSPRVAGASGTGLEGDSQVVLQVQGQGTPGKLAIPGRAGSRVLAKDKVSLRSQRARV